MKLIICSGTRLRNLYKLEMILISERSQNHVPSSRFRSKRTGYIAMNSFRLRKSTFPIEGVYSKIPTLKVKSTFSGESEERRATKTIRKTANERELFVLHKIWPILECALSIWFNNLDVLAKWPSNRGQCQRLPAFYSRILSLLSNPVFRGFHTDKLRHPAEINLLEISFLSSRKC